MKNEFKDPICGMTVTPETAAATYEQDGIRYHFCAVGCRDKFVAQNRPASAAPSGMVKLGRRKTSTDVMMMDTEGTHIDPVCKMRVSPETAAAEYEHAGTTYYFCNISCRDRFAADPESFLSEPRAADTEDPRDRDVSQIDPVCGMTVDPATAAGSHKYRGETYYFCSTGCETKFKSDPEKYLNPKEPEDQPRPDERERPLEL